MVKKYMYIVTFSLSRLSLKETKSFCVEEVEEKERKEDRRRRGGRKEARRDEGAKTSALIEVPSDSSHTQVCSENPLLPNILIFNPWAK